MNPRAILLLLARARIKERGQAKEKQKTKAIKEKIHTVSHLAGPAYGGTIIILSPGIILTGSIPITPPTDLQVKNDGTSDSFPAARPKMINIQAASKSALRRCQAASKSVLRRCPEALFVALNLLTQDPPGRISSAASRCVQLHVHVASHSRSSRLR